MEDNKQNKDINKDISQDEPKGSEEGDEELLLNTNAEESEEIKANKLEDLQQKYDALKSDYDALIKRSDLIDEKFQNFVSAYNALEQRCETMKKDMEKYRQSQRDGAKIEVAEMMLSMHNNIRIILQQEPNIIVLKMMLSQIENILNAWNVVVISPQPEEEYLPQECKIISSVSTEDENLKNRVSRLITIGYKMENRLIKAAEVEIFV